jgi:16S rRNA (uracil1498-N3)-methyltransferase
MRRRFFVDEFANGRSVTQGDAAHHLVRVLRAQAGQEYELSDGQAAWLARITSVERDRVDWELLEKLPFRTRELQTTLLLSVVKFDAFEWALEKATELGVNRIVPVAAERSEKALLAAASKRAERWKKILLGAAEQSRRVQIPSLDAPATAAHVFSIESAGLKLLLSERSDAPSLRILLRGATATNVALAVGPEGGWTDEELAVADRAGFRQGSMGELILRTETAVIAALASVNYEFLGRESQ